MVRPFRFVAGVLGALTLVLGLLVAPAAASGGDDDGRGARDRRSGGEHRDDDKRDPRRGDRERGDDDGERPQGRSQSDPDGQSNGGADKPGGAGGFDDDKDGNNGCGNDDDREDDNNGWCGRKHERYRHGWGGHREGNEDAVPAKADVASGEKQWCEEHDEFETAEVREAHLDKNKGEVQAAAAAKPATVGGADATKVAAASLAPPDVLAALATVGDGPLGGEVLSAGAAATGPADGEVLGAAAAQSAAPADTGGVLPFTGLDGLELLVIAAALVLGGALVIWAARRQTYD